jgi:hypothetical protein
LDFVDADAGEEVVGRMRILAPIFALLLVVCGCSTFSGRPATAREQILRQIPLGTQVDEATNRLARAGFKCGPHDRNGVFYDMAVTPRFTHTNATTMFCTRSQQQFFKHRRWTVGLPYDEHRTVTNVFVQVWDRLWFEF